MKTFPLRISSPDGDVFNGDVTVLNVRGSEGELAVMAGHIPFVSAVKPCRCRIGSADDSFRYGHTDGGILTVFADKAILLTGSFKFDE